MLHTASKLDWLKGRKDFNTDPVARAAIRLLEHQYAPHGDALYPWILREIRKGNIQLPQTYRAGWMALVKSEMAAERELARREAWRKEHPSEAVPEEWSDDHDTDWDDIENASWNKLTDFLDWFREPQSADGTGWEMLNKANGGQQFDIVQPPIWEGQSSARYPLTPSTFKDWDKVLADRAKRRRAVDPMQYGAAEFAANMNNEWYPEYEDELRGDAGEVVHRFPDKWTVRRLRDEKECEQEGEDMGHCVGGYGKWVEDRSTHIFSLRDPKNRPHTTVEIKPRSTGPEYDIWERHGLAPHRGWVETVNWLVDGGLEHPDTEARSRELTPDSDMWKLCQIARETRERRQQQQGRQPWHGGQLVQVYGKEDSPPKEAYVDRIRKWFGSLPPQAQPDDMKEYDPGFLDEPWDYQTDPGPDAWPDGGQPAGAPPLEHVPGEHVGSVHYPGLAHKSRIHGRICHCPWGSKDRPWSFASNAEDDWETLEGPPDEYLQEASQTHPYAGGNGKGLILPDRQELAIWATDEGGDPHHDDVGLPYVAKLDIFPSRVVAILSPDQENLFGISREEAEAILARLAPRYGLIFNPHTFVTHRRAQRQPLGIDSQTDANAVWTEVGILDVPPVSTHRPLADRQAAVGTLAVSGYEMPHHRDRISYAMPDWQDLDGPRDDELARYTPWTRGHNGKALIDQAGHLLAWQVNEYGEPHHDVVSQEKRFPYVAKAFVKPNGRAFVPGPDELHLFGVSREVAHDALRHEASKHGLSFVDMPVEDASGRTCPTCGDLLQGEHGTFCSRCSWSETDANLDSDPLSNPPDPTVDMHRGVQARVSTNRSLYHGTLIDHQGWRGDQGQLFTTQPLYNPAAAERFGATKMSDKLHDFLMNPKSRPDLQTPRAQTFLRALEGRFHNEKTDALMPWLVREWRSGRLETPWFESALKDHPVARALPDDVKAALTQYHHGKPLPAVEGFNVPGLYDALVGEPESKFMFYTAPHGRDAPLRPENVNHWADFVRSNHPVRREMGDIMKHDITSLHQRVNDWDEAMRQEAHDRALQGGHVVHTTPDNWTVRQLTKPEELTAEGEAMGHCVGGYGGQVAQGSSLIYSLRDPQGRPHVTTEIEPTHWQDPPGPNGEPGQIWGPDAGHENPEFEMAPVPHGGHVVQVQGRSNTEPKDEYKERLADWFRSFPPEQRPSWSDGGEEVEPLYDNAGYSHYTLDHPDLIPEYAARNDGKLSIPPSEPVEDAYGLLHYPARMGVDYDELLDNIAHRDWGYHAVPDPDHLRDIWRLAQERQEVPELMRALEPYEAKQLENFDEWLDMNWPHTPRYPDPDDPHGWEDEEGEDAPEGEGRPYWLPAGSEGERCYDPDQAEALYEKEYEYWQDQHAGMLAANKLWGWVNDYRQAQPEPAPAQASQEPPAAPQAFASTVPSHRWGKWLQAVEDAP